MTAQPLGIEVACDGPTGGNDCPDSAAFHAVGPSWTVRELRADGRVDGWTVRRAPGRLLDICPRCRATPAPAEETK